jgi:photosystem II stability/assembly factor-like uncharacterized protein
MKIKSTKSFRKAVIVALLLILTANISFGQWNPTNNTAINTGPWPTISVVNSSVIYAGGKLGTSTTANGSLFKSTNGGSSFTQITLPAEFNGKLVSSVCGLSANTVLIATGNSSGDVVTGAGFYKSTNGGTNFTKLYSVNSNEKGFFNGIHFSKSQPLVGITVTDPTMPTNYFKIWKTTDGGNVWKLDSILAGNTNGSHNGIFIIDNNFYGFGHYTARANDYKVMFTTNGGTTWVTKTATGLSGSDGFVSSVAFSSDKQYGIATANGIKDISRTTDGGQNWAKLTISISGFTPTNTFVKWVPGTPTVYILLSNATSTKAFRSDNNGATWIPQTFATGANITMMDLYYNPVANAPGDANVFSISTSGNIFTMTDSPLPVTLASFTYAVSGRNVSLKWITSSEQNNSGFEVYRIFGDANRSITSNWTNIGFIQGKGTINGNTEYNFSDKNLSTGKYYYRIKQIDYNGNYEYFDLNGSADIGAPSKVSLGQNYPNPFNPVTNIGYEIPQDARVTMKVYDIAGREISTLVNETQTAGYHTVKFDASKYSSGMYFYKVVVRSANGTISEYTKTMSVVK